MAAGLLTNLIGALLVAALGTGTTALMLRAAWLRNWLYHGQRQFFGIAGLRSLLDGDQAAITYSHELTASVDTSIFLVMCVAFPLIALALTGLPALYALGGAEAEQGGDPPRGGGGPPAPKAVPGGPGGAQLAALTRHDADPAPGLPSVMAQARVPTMTCSTSADPHEPLPLIMHDGRLDALPGHVAVRLWTHNDLPARRSQAGGLEPGPVPDGAASKWLPVADPAVLVAGHQGRWMRMLPVRLRVTLARIW